MSVDPIKSHFQKLCGVSERLITISREHRERPCVAHVESSAIFRSHVTGADATLYVELKLESRADMAWTIEVECEPQWNILAGIRIYRTSYEESLGDLGEWTASDSSEVNALLENAIAAVEESIRTFDFCQF